MQISCLRIVNLRSIESAELLPCCGLNVIIGPNGSGKTTILEAIHILHCGKSFRTGNFSDLVRQNTTQLAVHGDVSGDVVGGLVQRFRVSKSRVRTVIKINGEEIRRASVLAKLFPIQVFDSASFGLIDGSPKLRRSLIDKAVFHVEPDHVSHLQRYLRALQNRNQLLKSRATLKSFTFWDDELFNAATNIHKSRNACVDALNDLVSQEALLLPFGHIGLDYKSGWAENLSFDNVLAKDFSRDLSIGATQSGPHKAEVRIKAFGRDIARTASRGQIKMIVLIIVTIIAEFIFLRIGRKPVLLLDDIAAELDPECSHKVLERLAKSHAQAFVTATSEQSLDLKKLSTAVGKFHVKRGSVYDASFLHQAE